MINPNRASKPWRLKFAPARMKVSPSATAAMRAANRLAKAQFDTKLFFVLRQSIMSTVSRFGVSLEEDLLAAFDLSIGGQGYQNRSEAIRDLIRDHLIQRRVGQGNAEVIGVVTLVYDHRVHRLGDLLADMQH